MSAMQEQSLANYYQEYGMGVSQMRTHAKLTGIVQNTSIDTMEDSDGIISFTIGIAIVVIAALFVTAIAAGSKYTPPPCSGYANYSQRDLPARCIKYYEH